VIGGMLSATVLAVLFVPLFFVAVRRVFRGKTAPDAAPAESIPAQEVR